MVQPQGCPEVASICLCPGFLLAPPGPTGGLGFSLAGDAQPYWGQASEVGARAFYVILVMAVP